MVYIFLNIFNKLYMLIESNSGRTRTNTNTMTQRSTFITMQNHVLSILPKNQSSNLCLCSNWTPTWNKLMGINKNTLVLRESKVHLSRTRCQEILIVVLKLDHTQALHFYLLVFALTLIIQSCPLYLETLSFFYWF